MKGTTSTYRVGDCVRVKAGVKDPDWGKDIGGWQGRISGIDKGRKYAIPLCDLEATNKKSANYQLVKDYAIWFANR